MAKAKKSIKLRDPIVGLDQYGHRALQEAMATERDVEGASLEDRQEARDDFAKALKDPGLVAERIGWMLDGNYGQGVDYHGEMLKAQRIIASPRMNRRASLVHLAGMYEWRCPAAFGVQAWKKLTSAEKAALDAAVDVVIDAAEAEMTAEQE